LENQIFPTYRDIQRGFGFKSVAPVQNHIRKLKEAGLVTNDSNKARTLRLVEVEPPEPEGLVEEKFFGIPICGQIAAGGLIDFSPGEDSKEFIPPDLFSSRCRDSVLARFALRVQGDSMIGVHILDGDIVILDKPSNPNEVKDRAIVAARIMNDNQATLKRWQRKGDQVSLIPENPDYSTLQKHISQVLIEGVYVGLIRKML
jgi:repressor LexA